MTVFFIDGQEYNVSDEEYWDEQIKAFAAEFDIPYEKAKNIINSLDINDELSDRYDEGIFEKLADECKNGW